MKGVQAGLGEGRGENVDGEKVKGSQDRVPQRV